MTRSRRMPSAALLAGGLLLAAAPVASAAPAAGAVVDGVAAQALAGPAATPSVDNTRLLVASSPDGPWSPTLAGGILPAAPRLSPGDSVSGTIWVRNASTEPARLTVSSVADEAATLDPLADVLRVAVADGMTASAGVGSPTASSLTRSSVTLMERSMAPGQVAPVTLSALLPRTVTAQEHQEQVWQHPLTLGLGLAPVPAGQPSPPPASPTVDPAGGPAAQATDGATSASASPATTSASPTGGATTTRGAGEGSGPGGSNVEGSSQGGPGQAGGSAGAVTGQEGQPALADGGGPGAAPGGVAPAVPGQPDGLTAPPSGPAGGLLAHTGAEVLALAGAGAGATVAGLLLLAAARRRRRDEDPA